MYRGKLRVFLLFFQKFWYFPATKYLWYTTGKYVTVSDYYV